MATDLIEVPYALTLSTRADGVVRARVRGTRFRAAVALLVVCAAPALYLWRGEGWWSSGGTGVHTKGATVEALLAIGVCTSFLWRHYCASRVVFSATSVLVVESLARVRVPLSRVEGFHQSEGDATVWMRVRGATTAIGLFRPQGAPGSADWLNAMLPEELPEAVADVPEAERRRYVAVSDLALLASLGIAAYVLLAW
ncbi:hypothetical protein [Streptomyces sp. NPDC008125]|uniref:hypothetical protein n=1 Tax=Streptomyces sp. NPDC008125 TaxID=3364811 RepID=UPI0036EB384A